MQKFVERNTSIISTLKPGKYVTFNGFWDSCSPFRYKRTTAAIEGVRSKANTRRYVFERNVTAVCGVILNLRLLVHGLPGTTNVWNSKEQRHGIPTFIIYRVGWTSRYTRDYFQGLLVVTLDIHISVPHNRFIQKLQKPLCPCVARDTECSSHHHKNLPSFFALYEDKKWRNRWVTCTQIAKPKP